MTHRAFRTAQFGLVIVTAALLAACSQAGPGDSGRPTPAWSPPTWIHGTWKASSELGTLTVTASRYNIVIDVRGSGLTQAWDMAELADAGLVAITHDAGIRRGVRWYLLRVEDDTSGAGFNFDRLSETRIEFVLVTVTNAGRTEYPPIVMTKQ